MTDPQQLRVRSLAVARELGFPMPPPHLPLVGAEPLAVRSHEEIIERLLVLNVRLGLAMRMPPEVGRAWLADNDLIDCLTPSESARLAGAAGIDPSEQVCVEATWALAWTLGLVEDLDPASYCGDQLAALLPELRTAETAPHWRSRTALEPRGLADIAAQLDLHYVLTWGHTDTHLQGRPSPGPVEAYVHLERRRALEWMLQVPLIPHQGWDDIDLST